jgi:DNA-binding PadR family transcriptional regulator
VLELAILGLLQEQPRHGYELKKVLRDTLGSFWGVSFGSLYPALRRLERSGAIAVVDDTPAATAPAMPATGSLKGEAAAARLRLVPAAKGGRTRQAYRITPVGREQFQALLAADDGADDERLFTVKLAFCRFLDPEARLAFLERRRAELADRLNRARRGRGPAGDRYTRSLIEHRTRSTERDLEWIDDLIATEHHASGEGTDPPGAEQEGATA